MRLHNKIYNALISTLHNNATLMLGKCASFSRKNMQKLEFFLNYVAVSLCQHFLFYSQMKLKVVCADYYMMSIKYECKSFEWMQVFQKQTIVQKGKGIIHITFFIDTCHPKSFTHKRERHCPFSPLLVSYVCSTVSPVVN